MEKKHVCFFDLTYLYSGEALIYFFVPGTVENGTYDGYTGQGTNLPPERNPPYDVGAVVQTAAYRSLARLARRRLLRAPSSPSAMLRFRAQATVRCPKGPRRSCEPRPTPNGDMGDICLYDLRTDPCEQNNLTPLFPNVARYLFKALVVHRRSLVPQLNRPREPELANPGFFNGTWSTWYDLGGVPYASGNAIPDASLLFSANTGNRDIL